MQNYLVSLKKNKLLVGDAEVSGEAKMPSAYLL
jgi:hypothetical protein